MNPFLLSLFLLQSLFYDPSDDSEVGYEEERYYDEGRCEEEECEASDYFWYCDPYDGDLDECWYWDDEAVYPTRKDDSWMEELRRPW